MIVPLTKSVKGLVSNKFKLHNFGARASTSEESSYVGGLSHLAGGPFYGTDNFGALKLAKDYYNCPMAAYSVSANEHSTVMAFGNNKDLDAYRMLLSKFGYNSI